MGLGSSWLTASTFLMDRETGEENNMEDCFMYSWLYSWFQLKGDHDGTVLKILNIS